MALSNTTTLNDLIGSIVDEMVQEYNYAQQVMKPLIRFKKVEEGYNNVVIPRFAAVTVGALTQATAPTAEALATDGVTLTPTERGVLVTISKLALRSDPFADLEPYARTLGKALAQDQDSLILDGMEAALSTTVNNGGGAVDLSLTHFRTAITTLLGKNAPMPYYCVMHPASWGKIMAELDDAGAFSIVGRDVVEGHGVGMPKSPAGFVAAPYGVPVYLSTLVDATRDTNETYANVMFSSECWGLASTFESRVEVQEDKPARAFDLIAWYTQHNAELVDAYGLILEDQINP